MCDPMLEKCVYQKIKMCVETKMCDFVSKKGGSPNLGLSSFLRLQENNLCLLLFGNKFVI